jgi:hypothetical protein
MEHWPDIVTKEFWPFAVRHACTFHNASIWQDLGKSPHHLFTGNIAPWKLEDFHVFGSPAFILDKRLQDGDSLPKWKAQSWLGIYVGLFLLHSSNVPVIYNPLTMHISPQFHVVHDDQFTTISTDSSKLTDTLYSSLLQKPTWQHSDNYATIDDLYYFNDYWIDPPATRKHHHLSKKHKTNRINHSEPAIFCNPADHNNHLNSSNQAAKNTQTMQSNPAPHSEPAVPVSPLLIRACLLVHPFYQMLWQNYLSLACHLPHKLYPFVSNAQNLTAYKLMHVVLIYLPGKPTKASPRTFIMSLNATMIPSPPSFQIRYQMISSVSLPIKIPHYPSPITQ